MIIQAFICLSLLATGCTNAPEATATVESTGVETPAAPTPATDDAAFVEVAAAGIQRDKTLVEVVVAKAASRTVKGIATRLMAQQRDSQAQLDSIARRLQLHIPSGINNNLQHHLDSLNALAGADFERKYLSILSTELKKDMPLFENQANNGKDDALKAWASAQLPALKQYLDQVEAIRSMLQ